MNIDIFGALFTFRIHYGLIQTRYKEGALYVSVYLPVTLHFVAVSVMTTAQTIISLTNLE